MKDTISGLRSLVIPTSSSPVIPIQASDDDELEDDDDELEDDDDKEPSP